MKINNCNNCQYLNIKESNQESDKQPHICTKYNKQVKHLGHHPSLIPLDECKIVNFIEETIGYELYLFQVEMIKNIINKKELKEISLNNLQRNISKNKMVSLNKPIKGLFGKEKISKGWYFDVVDILIKIESRGEQFTVKLEDIEDVRQDE